MLGEANVAFILTIILICASIRNMLYSSHMNVINEHVMHLYASIYGILTVMDQQFVGTPLNS
jgi:general stress protein CsbA